MNGALCEPMIAPKLWFSMKIQITWVYLRGTA
jgi:hypothetical protein